MVQVIDEQNLKLAIIIRNNFFQENCIKFFTNDEDSQQLGYMNRAKDYQILPHKHNLHNRSINLTQEVLYIKSGRVRVDFYDNEQVYITSYILYAGDVILLNQGGHGFKMLENSEIIEIKQGPYCGELDKVRFNNIEEEKIIIKE